MARFKKNSFILENWKLHIIIEGRGFRGGSDEKMRRMWLGLEIDVVGLPPLIQQSLNLRSCLFILLSLKTHTPTNKHEREKAKKRKELLNPRATR